MYQSNIRYEKGEVYSPSDTCIRRVTVVGSVVDYVLFVLNLCTLFCLEWYTGIGRIYSRFKVRKIPGGTLRCKPTKLSLNETSGILTTPETLKTFPGRVESFYLRCLIEPLGTYLRFAIVSMLF